MGVDPLVSVLTKSLDALSMRQQVIAQNLSNINTPNYQPLQVDFEAAFQEALSRGNLADLRQLGNPVISAREPLGGEVVLDQEVALLSQTVLQYQAITRGISKQFALMQLAVTEGRR
jgi:flagellar basal-body rod protein FlgB